MNRRISVLFFLVCLGLIISAGCDRTPYSNLPEYERMSAAEIDGLIETGLTAWRASGSIDAGASCSGCHAPDGFDLAHIEFTDFHVRRRGAMHVGGEHSELNASRIEDIVNMIHAIRQKYKITPKEPLEYRPFQPGGQVLAAGSVSEREFEFLTSLQEEGYRFTTNPVLSKEEAFLQKEEWLSLNPDQLRIGIPLVRWSEDPQYSQSDTPLADWLPALPVLPLPGKEQQWFSLQQEYLRSPSDANLQTIFQRMGELTYVSHDGIGARLMLNKYRAVQLAQHIFRKEATSKSGENGTGSGERSVMRGIGENPFLSVAGIAYQLRNQEWFDFPDGLIHRYQLERNKDEQLAELQHAWYWLGWILDPGMIHKMPLANYNLPHLEKTDTPDPVKLPGFTDDYPLHYTYLITKTALDKAFLTQSDPQMSVHNLLPSVIINAQQLPSGDQDQVLFIENSWRMILHLFLDQTDGCSLVNCQTDGSLHSYPSEVLTQWQRIVAEIETGFKIFNSNVMDYNLELTSEVYDRLIVLRKEE